MDKGQDATRSTFAGPLAVTLLLAMLTTIAGCDYPDPAFQAFQQRFVWTEDRALAAGWIPPRRDLPVEPAYCYHTIGKPDCYREPAPEGEEPRLIDAFRKQGL